MVIYEDMNRIYGSSIFDSAVRRKNTFDVKPFDLKVPFPTEMTMMMILKVISET